MKKTNPTTDLKEAILLLEAQRSNQHDLLIDEAKKTYERLTLASMLKRTAKDLSEAPDFKNNLVNIVMSIGAGFFTKKAVIGNTHNPIKQLLGALVQAGVSNLVSRNAEGIKSVGSKIFQSLFAKKNKVEDESLQE